MRIPGNHITLLRNGGEYFLALEQAIDSACQNIHVETYIFEPDNTGQRIADALMRAARRGVTVRILVDGFGTRSVPFSFFAALEQAGAQVISYRPDRALFNFRKGRLRRLHRKIALVDGQAGFVGGLNILDDLNGSLSGEPRYDYAVKIEGPVLADLYRAADRLWQIVAWWSRGQRHSQRLRPAAVPAPAGRMEAAFLHRDNVLHRHDIEHAYLEAIYGAKAEILIVNPYFLPGRRFRKALRDAARRGVKITILLQGRADHPFLQLATRAIFTQLLASGIDIAEYTRSMLHGKVAVVDGYWATVGSSNLDPFSLLLNREANIVVWDREFAQKLRDSIQAECKNAIWFNHEQWRKRSRWARLKSWAAYGLIRMAAGMIGIVNDWDQ